MNPNDRAFRNSVALLLVLTLSNLGASFTALYACHALRDESSARAMEIHAINARLDELALSLCQLDKQVCPKAPPLTVGHPLDMPPAPSN
jgi:hypothetical protein